MEYKNDELQINLVDLFEYLKKRILIIVLVAAIGGLAGFLGNEFFSTPKYTATTRVYILNRQSENTIYYADLQSSSQFINDYTVLITGQNVTKNVIRKLKLDDTYEALASRISVTAPEDTRILEISVSHEDPQLAADIANAVREEATKQIETIMEVKAVNLIYEANLPESPSSIGSGMFSLVIAAAAMICCIAVFVVIFVVDDTMRTEEDIEKRLGLSVLGVIPVSQEVSDGSAASDKSLKKAMMNANY